MARTIAIACQKGGTGKTTTAMTLGAALGAEQSQRVLLVDLDPQSSLSISAQVDVLDIKHSVYDLLRAVMRQPAAPTQLLESAIVHTALDRVDMIPATLELANAELELTGALEREKILKRALSALRGSYDYILVDCPPSLGILTVNALVAADEVLVPMEADFLALRGVQLFMSVTLPQIRAGLNRKLRVAGILITKMDRRTLHAREVEQAIRTEFGELVSQSVIPQTVRFRDASIAGTTILSFARTSPAAQAYREVAAALLNGA